MSPEKLINNKILSRILWIGSDALGQAHWAVILSENVWRFEYA